MRTFAFISVKWDKRYIFLSILSLIIGIICSIVLYKNIIFNIYFKNFSAEYIFRVYNFKNSSLFFTYFFSELIFCFLFLALSYFLKVKYFSLLIILIKSFFIGIYVISLFSVNALSGTVVIVFIFLPSSTISIISNVMLAELCLNFDKTKALILPLILSLITSLFYLILINVVFRFIVSIV